jgi:hypothetical protein
MEILIYQILICIIIFFSGAFGGKARNITTIGLCLFTLIEVFTVKLAILQFITIFIAYAISRGYEEKKNETKEEFNYYVIDKKEEEKSKSGFGSFSIIFIIIISLFSTFYIFQKRRELKAEPIEIKKDTVVYKKGHRIFEPNNTLVETNVIETIKVDTVSIQDINKDNYLNNNFPEGYSEFHQVINLRANSFSTKNKNTGDEWSNWSENFYSKSLIIISIKSNRISIYSDDMQQHVIYNIQEINSGYKDKDGDNVWAFECVDENGISCQIRHSISNNKDLLSQFYIEYLDVKHLYNVYKEN